MKLVTGQDGFIGNARNIPSDRQREVEALVWDYNQTRPTDVEKQRELLKKILGTYNDKVIIQHGIHFDFGFNTHFLGMAFVNFNVTILDTSQEDYRQGQNSTRQDTVLTMQPKFILTLDGHLRIGSVRMHKDYLFRYL